MMSKVLAVMSVVACAGVLSSSVVAIAETPNNRPWQLTGKAADQKPAELEGIGIDEKLGQNLDASLTFTDDNGNQVQLSQYLNKGKPVIISPVYFNCPSLCNLHLNGLNDGFKQLDWAVGDKFEVVSFSINPKEDHTLAKSKKESYLKAYGRDNVENGWHFLTGSQENITKLAENLGFKYRYDEASKEFLHSAAAIVITPDGKISRYLHGVFFDPKTLRLSLVEASNGMIGEFVDSFMLFCFRYDPNKRTYAFYAYNIMKYGAGLAALALFAFMLPGWRKMMAENKNS